MCTMVGAWGRGVGTTGLREELGRSFGEGICEVVPGTLTNMGVTLRTWIYQVFSMSGQNLGYFPRAAGNVVFQYEIIREIRITDKMGEIKAKAKFAIGRHWQTLDVSTLPAGVYMVLAFTGTFWVSEKLIIRH